MGGSSSRCGVLSGTCSCCPYHLVPAVRRKGSNVEGGLRGAAWEQRGKKERATEEGMHEKQEGTPGGGARWCTRGSVKVHRLVLAAATCCPSRRRTLHAVDMLEGAAAARSLNSLHHALQHAQVDLHTGVRGMWHGVWSVGNTPSSSTHANNQELPDDQLGHCMHACPPRPLAL